MKYGYKDELNVLMKQTNEIMQCERSQTPAAGKTHGRPEISRRRTDSLQWIDM